MIPAALILLVLVFPLFVLIESIFWKGGSLERHTRSTAHGWYQAAGGALFLCSILLLIAGLLRWAWSYL